MGGGSSKQKGQVLSKDPPPPAAPEPPYPGPAAQYQFVNVQVSMCQQISFGFMNSSMLTSNVDAYYGLLAQQYEQGYRMLSFYHIPGQVKQSGGFFSPEVLMPFQGIFCKYPQVPNTERYQLRIEKSVIQPQIVWNGFITTKSEVVTDTQHLNQTIANNTVNGGRLICIELTGQVQVNAGFNMRASRPRCDLFFEVPMGPPSETYIYNIVSAPIYVSITPSLRPTPHVTCDWIGIMAASLSQGWKLVEIFMDHGQSSQAAGFGARSQMNSQWFFEKPASRANDPTPMYQGTIVEHQIKIAQTGFTTMTTTANWEPVIQDMGNRGWELACILETQEAKIKGLNTVYMKVILFFQRPIILPSPYPVPPAAGAEGGTQLPPYYDATGGSAYPPPQPSIPEKMPPPS